MPKLRSDGSKKEYLLNERVKKVKNLRHTFEEAAPEVKAAMIKNRKYVINEFQEYSWFNTYKWAIEEFEQISKYRSVNWGMYISVREVELYEVTFYPGGRTKEQLIKYHCSERLNSNEEETDTSTEKRETPSSKT